MQDKIQNESNNYPILLSFKTITITTFIKTM